jgi:hypothetical protein
MTTGARTPEELETLLEDAFLTRDRAGFQAPFDDDAVLAPAGAREARGGEAIGGRAAARPPPRRRDVLDPRGRPDLRGRRRGDLGERR